MVLSTWGVYTHVFRDALLNVDNLSKALINRGCRHLLHYMTYGKRVESTKYNETRSNLWWRRWLAKSTGVFRKLCVADGVTLLVFWDSQNCKLNYGYASPMWIHQLSSNCKSIIIDTPLENSPKLVSGARRRVLKQPLDSLQRSTVFLLSFLIGNSNDCDLWGFAIRLVRGDL